MEATTIDNRPELANAPQEPEEIRPAIVIDDEEYEIPRLDDLDLDEEQILYDVAGIALSDFMPAHPESPPEVKRAIELMHATQTRNPAFKRALVLIAYRRENRELSFEELSGRIGRVNGFDSELALYGKARDAAEEDAAEPDPPHST